QQDHEQELTEARARLASHQSEAERKRHLSELRDRLVREWESVTFEVLQATIREVVDRVEVDGTDCRVFLRP
ncbi:MAG TPA: hypothetical protein VIK11_05040, partial [Tepidiformaceae bacterium]